MPWSTSSGVELMSVALKCYLVVLLQAYAHQHLWQILKYWNLQWRTCLWTISSSGTPCMHIVNTYPFDNVIRVERTKPWWPLFSKYSLSRIDSSPCIFKDVLMSSWWTSGIIPLRRKCMHVLFTCLYCFSGLLAFAASIKSIELQTVTKQWKGRKYVNILGLSLPNQSPAKSMLSWFILDLYGSSLMM